MTFRKTHRFRYIQIVAVVLAAAMIATACGGDSDAPIIETAPSDTSTTTTTVESIAPTSTTEPVAEVDEAVAAADEIPDEIMEEIAEVIEEASVEDVPSDEVAEQVIEAANEAAPESELTLGDCTDWVADPDIVLDGQQAEECAAMLVAAVEACEGLDCSGDDDSSEPETPVTTVPPEEPAEPEPEPTITTAPPESEEAPEPEPEATTTTAPPEPELETEQPETEPETEQPETEPEDAQPQYSVGDVVDANEIWPDRDDIPDDLVCELQQTGWSCWTQPTEITNPSNEGWVPPQAGMVPEPHPECSEDNSTWDHTCIPPNSWNWGEFEVGGRVDETPRLSAVVLNFQLGCLATQGAPCRWLLGLMKWPLDYLGACPSCVLNEYLDRVQLFARSGSALNEAQEQHGWHNCATVIDPLVGEVPEHGNDVGRRLSDTGLSLAERCRAVLPEDVMLETGYRLDGTPPTRFDAGHAGCEDWAEYVEDRLERRFPYMPGCYRSLRLASEWMEHHYGVDERYSGGFNC